MIGRTNAKNKTYGAAGWDAVLTAKTRILEDSLCETALKSPSVFTTIESGPVKDVSCCGEYVAALTDTACIVLKKEQNQYRQLPIPYYLPADARATRCEFSSDATYLAVGYNVSPFLAILKRTGEAFEILEAPDNMPTGTVIDFAFSPDGADLFVAASQTFFHYKWDGNRFISVEAPSGYKISCTLSHDGIYLVTAQSPSSNVTPVTIYKRDGNALIELSTIESECSSGRVRFIPKEHRFILLDANKPHFWIYQIEDDSLTCQGIVSIPLRKSMWQGTPCVTPNGKCLLVPVINYSNIKGIGVFRMMEQGASYVGILLPAQKFNGLDNISYSSDGKNLIVGNYDDKRIYIYHFPQEELDQLYIQPLVSRIVTGKIGLAFSSAEAGQKLRVRMLEQIF